MADEAPKKKRKREETLEARITYHTPLKTFERLFQESSLEETRRVVRRKLGLADNARVQLSQIRGNNTIVLEDDDDFRAFCVAVKANPQVDVQVTLSEAATTAAKSHEGEDAPAPKRRKVKQKAPKTREESADTSEQPSAATVAGPPDTDVSISMSSHNANTSGLVSSPDTSKQTSPAFHLFPALTPATSTHTVAPIKPPPPKDTTKSTKEASKGPQNSKGEATTKPEKEKKERPKTRKSETSSAAALSPASREKAAAILKQHRDALEEKAKQPRKRTKKESVVREVATTKDKVQEAGVNEPASLTEKPEKKKKRPVAEESSDEREPAQATTVKEHSSSPVKGAKKGIKERSKAQGSPKAKSAKVTKKKESSEEEEAETHKALDRVSSDKPLVFPMIKKPAGKPDTRSAPNDSIPLEKELNPELMGKKKQSLVLCPICERPYHLRDQCPMVQKGGKALEDRLKILKRQGKNQFVKDIEKFLDTEKRRDMLNVLQPRNPSARHGSETFQDADGEDHLMQSDREDGSDNDSVRSMPESVTLPAHGTRSSVGVQRPGEGPDSVSSDDEDMLADAAQRKDVSDSSSEQDTPIRQAQPHPPTSPSLFGSSISSIKAFGTLQDTGDPARILVQGSSTEGSDENTEEGDEMDEEHTSGMKAGNVSSMKSQNVEESGSESDPVPLASTPERIDPPTQSQTTRSTLLPRLSQLTNFFRSGPAASPVLKTVPSPMFTPTSTPRPIHLPKDNHVKMTEDSNSETESSSDESDRASRIPKNQRASSRLAMHPRRSVLSQLP